MSDAVREEGKREEMTDDELLSAFETASISAADFHHRQHVRVVWVMISNRGAQEAGERFVAAIRRLAAAHGANQLYHETITRAWLCLIEAAARELPGCANSEGFLAAAPWLEDKSLLGRHYSAAKLGSEEARARFAEPDLEPLPAPFGV